MAESITIRALYDFGMGGTGSRESEVDFQTAQLMVKADVITLDNKPFKVKYVEVKDSGDLNFYVNEIIKSSSDDLTIAHIEKAK